MEEYIYSAIIDTGSKDISKLRELAELVPEINFEVHETNEPGLDPLQILVVRADLDALRQRAKKNPRGAGRKPQIIWTAENEPLTVGAVRERLAQGWTMAALREAYGVPRGTWEKRWAKITDETPDDDML